MMLHKLLSGMDRSTFSPEVISLMEPGEFSERFSDLGVPVKSLGMKRGVANPAVVFRLARHFRNVRPDIVQTWMYHSDIIGGIAAKVSGNFPVIWNIRHSDLDPKIDKRSTILTARLCAFFSRFLPSKIVCCAEKAKQVHVDLGYQAEKMMVIPNGFDLKKFSPSKRYRSDVFHELGLPASAVVVGFVSRYHPVKGHANLIHAASMLPDHFHLLLCGDGIDAANDALRVEINKHNLGQRVHLLGPRKDVARITASFDVAVLPSFSEGFSNTIGEAMACGIPCVVTDVGDSAFIVGETGIVVPPGESEALCGAIEKIMSMDSERRRLLGEAARERMTQYFSLESIVAQYQSLYLDHIRTGAVSMGNHDNLNEHY